MVDPSPNPGTGNDTGAVPDEEPIAGTPRWVKVLGLIVLILIVLLVGLMVFGGGNHGPGMHTP